MNAETGDRLGTWKSVLTMRACASVAPEGIIQGGYSPEKRSSFPMPSDPDARKAMTVKQAIAWLSKVEDKTIFIFVDCPYCGHGHQLAEMWEVVIMKGVDDAK